MRKGAGNVGRKEARARPCKAAHACAPPFPPPSRAGLTLRRLQALRAPIGLFATSPGATVVLQDCNNVQQVSSSAA